MQNDNIKRKVDFMNGVMRNPKLAKTFKDAMSSPIGSTKREQAKSVLSIMRKTSGARNDGQGGIFSDIASGIGSGFNSMFGGSSTPSSMPQSTPAVSPNYNNLLVFPAAPKLKAATSAKDPASIVQNVLKGVPNDQRSVAPTSTPAPKTPQMIVQDILSGQPTNQKSVPTPPPAPPAPVYHQGVIPRTLGAVAKQALPAVASIVPATEALLEWTGHNFAKVKDDAFGQVGEWFTGYTTDPVTGAKHKRKGAIDYKPLSETWGGKKINELYPSLGSNPVTDVSSYPGVAALPGSKDTATSTTFTTGAPQYKPEDVKALQDALVKNGFMTQADATANYGIFDDKTKAAFTLAQNGGAPNTGGTNTGSGPSTLYSTLLNGFSNTNKSGNVLGGGTNLAASNVARIMGVTPDTAFAQDNILDVAKAIATVEGYFNGTSKIAIRNNNPGNLKYAGQAGATQDSSGFAVFATPEAGAQALINDLTFKQKSGKYATINDLMKVYSPDSDNPGSPSYGSGAIASDAQSAVNAGTGPGLFAKNAADAKFGGGLDQYMTNLDEKLKKDFNLEPLEQELSNLKAQGTNLVPTLQTYMKGRDQYISFVDDMIDKTEGQLLTLDMSDPVVANSYKNQLQYLYTLKGRQNTRYSNFLNAAVADYNADLTKTQNNYNNVYSRYQAAMTQQGTMAQNEYNNLYTTMADLYTNLEQAPTKRANAQLLQEQLYAAQAENLKNGVTQAQNTNPKFLEDKAKYLKDITVDAGATDPQTGTLDMNKIGPNGLIDLYTQINFQGGDQRAMTEAIRIALAKTLEVSGNDPKKVTGIKKMIDALRDSGYAESETWADSLSTAISLPAQTALSKFIVSNIDDIKKATSDLVKGSFWGRKPGIEDKATWMKDYANLGTDFLESLYNAISINVGQGTLYEKDPSSMIDQIFNGKTDQEKADNLASIIAVS